MERNVSASDMFETYVTKTVDKDETTSIATIGEENEKFDGKETTTNIFQVVYKRLPQLQIYQHKLLRTKKLVQLKIP